VAGPLAPAAVARPVKVAAAPPPPPVVKAEKWSAKELAEVRTELDEQSRELRSEISEAQESWDQLQRDGGDGAGDDQADAGTKTFEREHELSLANNSRDLLAQVERALERLADGTYGVCENCGNPIEKARLKAFPRATLCVTCKQREERR
jgi:DnaK suppressor protein